MCRSQTKIAVLFRIFIQPCHSVNQCSSYNALSVFAHGDIVKWPLTWSAPEEQLSSRWKHKEGPAQRPDQPGGRERGSSGKPEEALAGPSLRAQRGLFWCVDEEKKQPRKRMQSPSWAKNNVFLWSVLTSLTNKAIRSDCFFLPESTCFCHLWNLYTSKFTATLKTFSYPEKHIP